MPKTFLKKSTGWTEMKSIFVKKSTGWTETKSIFIKKLVTSQFGQLATWVKVYTKASLPDTTTLALETLMMAQLQLAPDI